MAKRGTDSEVEAKDNHDFVDGAASGSRCGRVVTIRYIGGYEGATVAPTEKLAYVLGRHLVVQHCDTVACHHDFILKPRSGCLRAVQAKSAKRKKKSGGG